MYFLYKVTRPTLQRLVPKHTNFQCHKFNTRLISISGSVVQTRNAFPWIKITTGLLVGGLILYDGVFNRFTYVGATRRFLRSLQIVTLVSFDYIWLLMKSEKMSEENYNQLLKEMHLKSANRILKGCLLNGGLYIKVGQAVSSINHVLPDEYTSTLSKLHNECLPSTEEDIQQVFKKDLGKLPEEIFEEFDYKAIAAASLAQVFKAKLKSGEDVAVKVQYLDLQGRFSSDLGTIIFLQDIVEFFFKNYNFGWIFYNLRGNLEKELDFINEGKNSERCLNDLCKFKFIHVPKVYWNLTTKRILTLEWIDGYKITDMNRIGKDKIDLKDLDTKLFNVFSEQIFNSGFIHADPHPGNIFVRKRKSGDIELVLLDHGLYEWLSPNERTSLCKFWEATVLCDEETMKQTAKQLNVNEYKVLAEILFQAPFKIEGDAIKTRLTDEDIKYVQDMAKNHFDKIMQTLKEMPLNMVLVLRNLNTIRAIGRNHGDIIDRPRLMARYAQKCVYNNKKSLRGYLKWLIKRIQFEYCLLKRAIKISIISLYLDMLYKLGRSPKGSSILKVEHS